jgi:hypothetical protein
MYQADIVFTMKFTEKAGLRLSYTADLAAG